MKRHGNCVVLPVADVMVNAVAYGVTGRVSGAMSA